MSWVTILKGDLDDYTPKDICYKTKLKKYPTKEDAEMRIPMTGKKPSTFKCEYCGEFHRKSTLPPDYKEQWKKNIEEQLRRIR